MKRYPEAVASIVAHGHEIGCHGNNHEILGPHDGRGTAGGSYGGPGASDRGGREGAPGLSDAGGEISEETLVIAKELGFTYSSSLSDDDVPYVREISGLFGAAHPLGAVRPALFLFHLRPSDPPGQSRSARMDDVLKNWLCELEGARRFGTLFNLQLDPQAIGQQGRIFHVGGAA